MNLMLKAIVLVGAIGTCDLSSAQAQAPANDPQPVEIVLSNFEFAPKELHLRQGQSYRLHFVNSGSGGHNFSAPNFFAGAQIDPADAAAITKGGIELAKGETRDVRLKPAAGTYKVKCTHFMHSAFGMKGKITVD
jgi:plastocyanin